LKKILIMAGGTAAAWHIVQTIKEYFYNEYEIHICDINSPELIAASKYAYKYHQVPYIDDPIYKNYMYKMLEKEKIDIVMPLIDFDLQMFAFDDPKLKELGIISTAPLKDTFERLTDKRELYSLLKTLDISALQICEPNDIDTSQMYVLKPAIGFGSKGFRIVEGSKIFECLEKDDIIQELCVQDNNVFEITAEIYNYGQALKIFQRQRIETKQGVCTKMKIVSNSEIDNNILKLVKNIHCPTAFCIQFLYHNRRWCMNDCNLRLGAGTALSSKAGFQLTRALLATLLDGREHDECLIPDKSVKSVVRVYDEVIMR